jgi:hypothetical protein
VINIYASKTISKFDYGLLYIDIKANIHTYTFIKKSRLCKYCTVVSLVFHASNIIADAASEPEASEQVSSSNSYWALKIRFYFRFSDQNALLLTDQNALLLDDQNALHACDAINTGNLISQFI